MTSLETAIVCFDDALIDNPSEQALIGYYFSSDEVTGAVEITQRYSPSADDTSFYFPTSITGVEVTRGPVLYGSLANLPIERLWIDEDVTYIDCSVVLSCSSLISVTCSGDWDVVDLATGDVVFARTEEFLGENCADTISDDGANGYAWRRAT